MKLYATGYTSALAELIVSCEWGAKNNLQSAMFSANFESLICRGRHPHREQEFEGCTNSVLPLQRGASNVYFSVTKSVLSLPPWINPIDAKMDEVFNEIQLNDDAEIDSEKQLGVYNKQFIGLCSLEEFITSLRKRMSFKTFQDIKRVEFNSITNYNVIANLGKNVFKAEEHPMPEVLNPYFERIISINRLREILSLTGFVRNSHPDPEADIHKNLVPLDTSHGWLPAVVVNGEGFLMELKNSLIKEWLNQKSVQELSYQYCDPYTKYTERKGYTHILKKDCGYVLLHTLSHILMRELSLKCGYDSASLQERIYYDNDMSGILIYTGSADKEGSLGGLVEMSNSHLLELITNALNVILQCIDEYVIN